MAKSAFDLFAEKVVMISNSHSPYHPDYDIWKIFAKMVKEVQNEMKVERYIATPTLEHIHFRACIHANLRPTFDRAEELYYNKQAVKLYDAYIAGWKAATNQ